MHRANTLVSLVSLPFLAIACIGPASTEAGGSSVTKSRTDQTRTWVGRVTQNGWSCSGSLIEPRIVITAKHCLDEGIAPSSVTFKVGTGRHADTIVARAIGLHSIGAFHAEQGVPDDDFAAIALDRPVTRVATGPAPSTTVIDRLEGESVVVVGFGARTEGGASGMRRSGTGKIKDVFGGYTDAFQLDSSMSTATSGDSGGPVILASTGEIIGVVSGGTIMARVDTHADLIEAARRDVANTPAATGSLTGRGSRTGGATRRGGDERSGEECACDVGEGCDLDDDGNACSCDAGCDEDGGDEDAGDDVCACDLTWSCDDDGGADCACDPECSPSDASEGDADACACDATWACDVDDGGADCACDPECSARDTNDGGAGDACACDATWSCDQDDDGWDCACDPECAYDGGAQEDAPVDACSCDATWDCDADDDGWDCACDPEC